MLHQAISPAQEKERIQKPEEWAAINIIHSGFWLLNSGFPIVML
jgi:hypothetical protein